MRKGINCYFCGESGNRVVLHSEMRYSYPAKIYKCSDCDFVFLHPRLSQEEQDQYYSSQ